MSGTSYSSHAKNSNPVTFGFTNVPQMREKIREVFTMFARNHSLRYDTGVLSDVVVAPQPNMITDSLRGQSFEHLTDIGTWYNVHSYESDSEIPSVGTDNDALMESSVFTLSEPYKLVNATDADRDEIAGYHSAFIAISTMFEKSLEKEKTHDSWLSLLPSVKIMLKTFAYICAYEHELMEHVGNLQWQAMTNGTDDDEGSTPANASFPALIVENYDTLDIWADLFDMEKEFGEISEEGWQNISRVFVSDRMDGTEDITSESDVMFYAYTRKFIVETAHELAVNAIEAAGIANERVFSWKRSDMSFVLDVCHAATGDDTIFSLEEVQPEDLGVVYEHVMDYLALWQVELATQQKELDRKQLAAKARGKWISNKPEELGYEWSDDKEEILEAVREHAENTSVLFICEGVADGIPLEDLMA